MQLIRQPCCYLFKNINIIIIFLLLGPGRSGRSADSKTDGETDMRLNANLIQREITLFARQILRKIKSNIKRLKTFDRIHPICLVRVAAELVKRYNTSNCIAQWQLLFFMKRHPSCGHTRGWSEKRHVASLGAPAPLGLTQWEKHVPVWLLVTWLKGAII